jgi:hypothetical protein
MSTLVIVNTKKVLKYIGLFFLVLIGLYIATIMVQVVFNLGTYLGTFMHFVYAFICN